jgi:hypothetical protein
MYASTVKSQAFGMFRSRTFAGSLVVFVTAVNLCLAQSQAPATTAAASPQHHASGTPGSAPKTSPYRNVGHAESSNIYYRTTWGIEQLQVRSTSSGNLLRFSYRVVDPVKAKVLQEKKAEPHMIGLRTHAVLSVPSLENVGTLRQTEGIQADKDYWVLFSNKGNLVKVGDRVDVAIGSFYATGLTVE